MYYPRVTAPCSSDPTQLKYEVSLENIAWYLKECYSWVRKGVSDRKGVGVK